MQPRVRSVYGTLVLLLFVAGCSAPAAPSEPRVSAAEPTTQPSPTVPLPTTPIPTATATSRPTDTAASTATTVPSRATIRLVGALRLEPRGQEPHGDVAAYKQLAFVGKTRMRCPPSGVDIIDISNPRRPAKLASTPVDGPIATEDMQATRIGERDVLAIGLQACGGRTEDDGRGGLDLIDITDPRAPRRLSRFATPGGVHELNLTTTPGGRTLALLAVPHLEVHTADASGAGGEGDLMIVDISDPTKPALMSEWGILGEPRLGPAAFSDAQQGAFPDALLHSVRADPSGTRLYLSYWDAGVILLDIADPARPVYLGRTTFAADEEGNAHSIVVRDNLLVTADEDFSPDKLLLTSNAFTGKRPVAHVPVGPPIREDDAREFAGEIVSVGRGCPSGAAGPDASQDVYDADPRGKIALIARGTCEFAAKIERAQNAGATGVIIYGGSTPVPTPAPALPTPTRHPVAALRIPAVLVSGETGRALRDGLGPVRIELAREFVAWGGLRFFDVRDPSKPQPLSTFLTPHASDPDLQGPGRHTAHNPEMEGTTVYASWYNDGIWAIDIGDPRSPRALASWNGDGLPGGAEVSAWSVVPHNGLLIASDLDYGLYILRLER